MKRALPLAIAIAAVFTATAADAPRAQSVMTGEGLSVDAGGISRQELRSHGQAFLSSDGTEIGTISGVRLSDGGIVRLQITCHDGLGLPKTIEVDSGSVEFDEVNVVFSQTADEIFAAHR